MIQVWFAPMQTKILNAHVQVENTKKMLAKGYQLNNLAITSSGDPYIWQSWYPTTKELI